MSLYKELSYDVDIDAVKSIEFSIMSPEDIIARSVAEITKRDTYDGNFGVYNGIFDPRLGSTERNKICPTCSQDNSFCCGHFGHIVLAKPCFFVQFFEFTKKVLGCVCFKCSKLLVDPNSDKIKAILSKNISRQKRYELITKECASATVKKCLFCLAKKPSISKEGVLKLSLDFKEKEKDGAEIKKTSIILNAEDVLRIFRRITDMDAEILGFSKIHRPEHMICTVMPVPPPSVRPSVRNDVGQRSEDDLTHSLMNIVKYNKLLSEKLTSSSKDQIDIFWNMLQYEVATFIDNTIPGIPQSMQRNGRANRSLMERLKSKEGRIRGNLMGKRVDFSARSVITPDPNISIDQLGVPFKIAMNLTIPEIVNRFNMNEMIRYVKNGPNVYPGAKFVKKAQDGRTVMLKVVADRDVFANDLKEGDVVERHLRDGDFVLFNRQPSLHKVSMLGHRVVVMPYNTFRLNVCVTPGYNGDFDGDELNMHVPQSLQAHEELAQLAGASHHIISARECKPIVAIVQDICLGVYRITKSSVRISEKQMFNLVSTASHFNGTIPLPEFPSSATHAAQWTGRQLLSTIIPEKVNAKFKTDLYDDNASEEAKRDCTVEIKNGVIVSGTFDKGVYQQRTKGLVHSIFNEYGADRTRNFFDDTQKLMCNWLVQSGFSMGVSDLIIPASMTVKFVKNIKDMKAQVFSKIKESYDGEFDNKSTKSNNENFEDVVRKILDEARDSIGRQALSEIDENTNRMINMIKSKSKGAMFNVSQMIGCVGQQSVEGKRIPYSFEQRTLPHFQKYDDGPSSRGFVENSFIKGLSPQEFFFHAMGGREGLIDTAVNSVTWETPIIIMEGGRTKYVRIGEWIDGHIEKAKSEAPRKGGIRCYPKKGNMELLDVPDVFIPTVDEGGNVTWGQMTAVNRHDPGERLYKVKTQGGREVTAAESKSLLVWDEGKRKFLPKDSQLVRVGDCVPVTMNLVEPPVIVEFVDMTEYLSKTDHVYGTDFNRAVKMTAEEQGDDFRIPRGWWADNNGREFTLPYTKKALLTRALGRSNVENIKDGFVYPYHATRCHGGVPDKFPLNKENGTFIGLFLADGHTCEKAGIVGISKNDPDVQRFVIDWFTKHGFTSSLKANTNDIGTSYTVEGRSTLLARFLDRFVGHGSLNKFVPDVAFSAPEEFVCGLLSGYFSGDGTVARGSVCSGSVSQRLTEGIAMLCTRLGAFAKISTSISENHVSKETRMYTMHRLSVRAQWASILAEKLDLIHPAKRDALQAMRCAETHANYEAHNDVVFDKITSIEVIGVEGRPKLYDVTVPSTLNFVLANGLGSRDTSETGYLQRKLVKAMEDCKVAFDYSVRTANGTIVQFLYGDDGVDPTKLESQTVPYAGQSAEQVAKMYSFVKDLSDLKAALTEDAFSTIAPDWLKSHQLHITQILTDNHKLSSTLFKNKFNTTVMCPVSFKRIIDYAVGIYEPFTTELGHKTDLTPDHVLAVINFLTSDIKVSHHQKGTELFNILIRAHLSPKRMICECRFPKAAFDFIAEKVRYMFVASLATPSDLVGIVAAQSIGEPSTQLTLNTFHSAGIANSASRAVQGVSRLKELLGVSVKIKTPEMAIHFTPKVRGNEKKSLKYMQEMRLKKFKDIVKTSSIYYDPDDDAVAGDEEFVECNDDYDENGSSAETPWVIRFEVDKMSMKKLNLSMADICVALQKDRMQLRYTDENVAGDTCIVRLRPIIKAAKEKDRSKDNEDILVKLKAMEHAILESIVLGGIPGIERVSIERAKKQEIYNEESKEYESVVENVVYTAGTNLEEVLGLPYVDKVNTMTNDICEIHEKLGLEAARAALYNEIKQVLSASYVDYRHIALLVDVMTSRGILMSISRHGLNKSDIGPLAASSFEMPDKKLVDAGVFGAIDRMNGVSANIMLGQVLPAGTGDVDVFMDESVVNESRSSGAVAAEDCVFVLKEFRVIARKVRRKDVANELIIV